MRSPRLQNRAKARRAVGPGLAPSLLRGSIGAPPICRDRRPAPAIGCRGLSAIFPSAVSITAERQSAGTDAAGSR
jgi:hypothetical protein